MYVRTKDGVGAYLRSRTERSAKLPPALAEGTEVEVVGEEEVGEDGAFLGGEFLGPRVVNVGPDNVGREEVGGELDPAEAGLQGLSQGVDSQRFGESREAFHEEVVAGQETDQHAIDEFQLSDEDTGNFGPQGSHEGGTRLDFGGKFFGSHVFGRKIASNHQPQASTVDEKSDRAIGLRLFFAF
jgi:hypothetical protein